MNKELMRLKLRVASGCLWAGGCLEGNQFIGGMTSALKHKSDTTCVCVQAILRVPAQHQEQPAILRVKVKHLPCPHARSALYTTLRVQPFPLKESTPHGAAAVPHSYTYIASQQHARPSTRCQVCT